MAPKTEPSEYKRARHAYSDLQQERVKADCSVYLPAVLHGCPQVVKKMPVPAGDQETIKELFPSTYETPLVEFVAGTTTEVAGKQAPIKVGVVLSGGQAPGGHNVIAGIFDGIKQWHPDSTMVGFLDGPHGVFSGNFVEITADIMDGFRNTGGFDMLGSGRHKIESDQEFQDSLEVCKTINLDGLVVIGGDDSNTNGALLAEYFKAKGCKTKVVGAPKTIDGDLKCPPHVPISFGFDTACKTYSTLVGNVAVDALSAQKYYHIVRLMGRSASNIALEVALSTRPNACLIGEEVARDKKSLKDITKDLADLVEERSKLNMDYGVIILPEGLIEFIPEFNQLMAELNDKLASPGVEPTEASVLAALSPENADCFKYLPDFIRAQLLLDRDPHGNVQVAKIDTEQLLAATVSAELELRRAAGTYKGQFTTQFHSYGYEGRAGMPTIFDASYCYALGATCAFLLANDCTGVLASVKNLLAPAKEWQCGGVPITSLCVIERRKGKNKPVIKKALVELDGDLSQPFEYYRKFRTEWRLNDAYNIPGPIQFDMLGCPTAADVPITLQLELGKQLKPLVQLPKPSKMGNFLYIPQPVESRSELQQWRMARKHSVPPPLESRKLGAVDVAEIAPTMCMEHDMQYIGKFFQRTDRPLLEMKACSGNASPVQVQKVGVVFCGRQAPGYHDFVCGLVDFVTSHEGSKVIGFVGGTKGFFAKQALELTPEICHAYAGTGGLELLGRTVDRMKSPEELEQARVTCEELKLTSLILLGGARTNSDIAYLAEHFRALDVKTAIIGAPCGIEGNMVNEFVETSIGFDSAAKAIAHLVGNTEIDGSSARKYYYFLRVMDGSSTGSRIPSSHLALEVALQTKPNMLLMSEEVDHRRMNLREVVNEVADMVTMRAADGKNFGTILVAEGLLGAIPEFRTLIRELEAIPMPQPVEKVVAQLTQWSKALFQTLPSFIQQQLLLERQSNAAVQMTQLATERLLVALVEDELKSRKKQGKFSGSFSAVCQFIGYQARCSVPSNFDSDYAYTLGATSALLAAHQYSGYMAIVENLSQPVDLWRAGGVPFTAMLTVPHSSHGESFQPRPGIFPRHVAIDGTAFKKWYEMRAICAKSEMYQSPGPKQLTGGTAGKISVTIKTKFAYLRELDALRKNLAEIANRTRAGCDSRSVRVASRSLTTLNKILDELMTEDAEMEAGLK